MSDAPAQDAARPIARPSGLAEEVYRRIRADIMSLRLPPESRVSVDSLARELGVSQTPIREALSMLEANGLVSKRHFAGYATTPRMDRAQLDELFEFRLLIEPHAARKAAEMMGDADMALLASGETAPSHDAFADMDTDFHRLIAQGAGNHLIADSLDGPTVRLNVVPGNGKPIGDGLPNLNQGAYKQFENEVRELASTPGNKVEIVVEPRYSASNTTNRPDQFIASYRVNGGDWNTRKLINK